MNIFFANWKFSRLLEKLELHFPSENLFQYSNENPNYLKGKTLLFRQYWLKEDIKIFWAKKISKFARSFLDKITGKEEFLYLGTFKDGYIHILIKENDEIWFGYDIINKEEFWAKNMREALVKLFLQKIET